MNRDTIRDIFIAAGFDVKEGETDLDESVYEAANMLLCAANFATQPNAKKCIIGTDVVSNDALVASVTDSAPNELQPLLGLPLFQESKYTFNGTHIVNRASGEVIPHDEPVFLLRARDKYAWATLQYYLRLITTRDKENSTEEIPDFSDHHYAIWLRLRAFTEFSTCHPERMKTPDTVLIPARSDEG